MLTAPQSDVLRFIVSRSSQQWVSSHDIREVLGLTHAELIEYLRDLAAAGLVELGPVVMLDNISEYLVRPTPAGRRYRQTQ